MRLGPRATGRQRTENRQAENRQGTGTESNRQAENREQAGREQGTIKYYYSDAYSGDPGAPIPLRLPRSRQAASYLHSHTPLAPDKQGSADLLMLGADSQTQAILGCRPSNSSDFDGLS